jgi:serine/threonine protein kinase/tetratricopeptide (TPR) repeat protein
MAAIPDVLQRALDALTDDQPCDWQVVDAVSGTEIGERLQQLRLVARIARAHQTLCPNKAVGEAVEPPFEWGHLKVRELVGRGTYGDVYRAHDPRLDRDVALKLLRYPEKDREAVESAVIEEGRLLARVRHPNVVTVHGAERIAARVGIWMEFVEGRTLEQELAADGPFSANQLIAVGTAICRALRAVHGAGLLHRDVKGQNVIRDRDGRIVLTDFGTGRESLDFRGSGDLVGTPVYLAPEVLEGGPASVRSEVYSVGVLLHHLATGAYPVCETSIPMLRDAHRTGRRAPVQQQRPDLPRALARVIDRATGDDPDARFGDAGALEEALQLGSTRRYALLRRAWWAAAAALVLAVSGLAWLWSSGHPTSASRAPQSILVSRFDNETGDPRLDRVLETAFEQELTQSRVFSVIPRERIADTLRLMKRPAAESVDAATAREICLRDGGISAFLIGRIDHPGSRFTLHVAINDPRTGASILRTGVDVADIDALLDNVRELAARIRRAAGENRRELEADAQLETVTTGSLEALQAYSRGVALVNEQRWAAAELPLCDAIRLDPNFASALMMLAHCVHNQDRPEQDYLPIATRAFGLSDGLPSRERYFIVGSYYDLRGELAKAIPAYEALVREHPTDFWGLNNLVVDYHETGRYRDEVPLLLPRAALRPHDYTTQLQTATWLIITAGDRASARRLRDRAAALQVPASSDQSVLKAWSTVFPAFDSWVDGRVAEAAAYLDRIATEARNTDAMGAAVGLMNLTLGRIRAAQDAFGAMSSESERQELMAMAALARGDLAGARAALRADPNLFDVTRPDPGRGVFGKSTLNLWTMIRAGLTDEATAYAARGIFDRDPTRWIEGELAAAHGDTERAIPILEAARAKLAPGNMQTLIAYDTLSAALLRQRNVAAAEGVMTALENTRATTYGSAGSRGYLWLRLRARLLQLERELGHTDRADAINRDLHQLLQVADSDFDLLRLLD